jgi:hypothetical protein
MSFFVDFTNVPTNTWDSVFVYLRANGGTATSGNAYIIRIAAKRDSNHLSFLHQQGGSTAGGSNSFNAYKSFTGSLSGM